MREYHKQVFLGLKFLLSRGLPLVLVSAAAAGVFLLKTPNSAKQASAPGARDPNATVGQYEGKSEAEIQAELDKVVQEGMFNISINPDISPGSMVYAIVKSSCFSAHSALMPFTFPLNSNSIFPP